MVAMRVGVGERCALGVRERHVEGGRSGPRARAVRENVHLYMEASAEVSNRRGRARRLRRHKARGVRHEVLHRLRSR